MPEGIKVLKETAKKHQFNIQFDELILLHVIIMKKMENASDDWKEKTSGHDAIYFGAVDPSKVPDHISSWGSLPKFRREFDQYINLRPVKLFNGVPCPLANKNPGDIDMLIVRENTRGRIFICRRKNVSRLGEGNCYSRNYNVKTWN